jgi:putative transposase
MARKSKFSESDIISAIRELEGGATQTEVARRMGVSTQTMQRWRAKYGGMTVSEAQEKRRMEDENRKLRSLVAQYALENESLKIALGKKW